MHMHLLESIQKSESIKSVERHQRKSLGQIRNLVNEICNKRKNQDRDKEGFQAHRVNNLTKKPDMKDVREATRTLNKQAARLMLQHINNPGKAKVTK